MIDFSQLRKVISKFITINDANFDRVIQDFRIRKLKKNEIWEPEGKISTCIGFVNRGLIKDCYLKDGNEFVNEFYKEGDFLGNYISYFQREPSKTFSVALEESELLVTPFKVFESHFESIPETEEFSQLIGQKKLYAMNERNQSLLMDTPEERYQKFIDNRPDLINRVPQYLIAEYLGIKPESLSRIRKKRAS